MTTRPPLFISRDADADWITAIEVGHIDDGVPAERWEPLNCWVAWLLDHDGRKIGVRLEDASEADLRDDVFADLWDLDGPRFDAPTLGLTDVPIAAALTAALPIFGDQSSLNRFYFKLAIASDDDPTEALTLWQLCLQTGDLMAHYGLGYTHFLLGHHRAAYTHLRFYSQLATNDAWTWCWLGRAALAVGEEAEGVAALSRAIAIERASGGKVATDAAELLEGR